MMINVLLLNPPFYQLLVRDNYCCHTSKGDYVWAPSDLLYLSGIMTDAEVQLKVLDAVVDKRTKEEVLEEVEAFQPNVVITLSGTLSFSTDVVLLDEIKARTGCRHYVMGNLPAFNPRLVLEKYAHIEGVIHNFFDIDILSHIKNPIQLVDSVSCRLPSGDLHIGRINYLPKRGKPMPPVPRYDLFPNHKYTTPISYRTPMTTVITAFGCPYGCDFCVASALNLYMRDIKNVEAEFDSAKEAGIKELFFMDSTFNAHLPRMREICQLMVDKGYGFTWSCNVHSLRWSLEDFQLMKQAGCHTIQIGVEAGTQESLDKFAPTKKLSNLKSVFEAAHKAGLRTLAYFIIGFPEEGKDQVEETISFALELDPFFASFTTLVPDYGTDFYLEAVEKRMIQPGLQTFDNSGTAILENTVLTKEEREVLLKRAYRKFYFRPRQLWKYVSDVRNFPLYMRNGVHLIKKYFTSASA